jgi:hypothetical protein
MGDAFVVFGDGENAEVERRLVLAGAHAFTRAEPPALTISQPADQRAMSRGAT